MSGPFRSQDPERSVQRNQTAPNSRPRSAVTLGNRTQRIPQSEISTEVGFLEFVRMPVIRRKRGDPPDMKLYRSYRVPGCVARLFRTWIAPRGRYASNIRRIVFSYSGK